MGEKLRASGFLLFIFVLLAIVIGASWKLIDVYIRNFGTFLSNDHGVFGQFGDYVGGILNPLIGFCTLIFLAVSVWQARKGVEALHSQIGQAKQHADDQLEIMQSERDLNAAIFLLEKNRERIVRAAESKSSETDFYINIEHFLDQYVDRELQALMDRSRKKLKNHYNPLHDFQNWGFTKGEITCELHIDHYNNCVIFECLGHPHIRGVWAQNSATGTDLASINDDQILTRSKIMFSESARDVGDSIVQAPNYLDSTLTQHPNIFPNLDALIEYRKKI